MLIKEELLAHYHRDILICSCIGNYTFARLKYLGIEDIIVAGTVPTRLEKVKQLGGIPCNNKEINVNHSR
jgi:threonine dehydrogenase-like Zn-dependent dehydrogenase